MRWYRLFEKDFNKVLETDVLIVGGSGAAVSAALECKKSKLDVMVVSKGKIGRSGNAIMAGGGFSIDGESAYSVCGEENANRDFDQDALFDSIVKESYYLSDQRLVEQYVYESPEIVREFLALGKRAGQKFLFSPGSNSWISAGLSWGRAAAQGIKENKEIVTIEDVMVIDVIKSGDIVNGAIGINIYSGELILFKAKAVILATGGFQPCTLKNTVSDMTGDGIGIAYRAGAKLADMEFLLAFATALYPTEAIGSIYPFVMEFNMPDVDFIVRNGSKEIIDIPAEVIKISRGKKLSKLISMYYYGIPIFNGEGTERKGVYLDYSVNDKDKLKKSLDNFFEKFSLWHRKGYYKGDDMSKVVEKILDDGLIEIGLGYEYSMGGVLIDETMSTSVPGLFAAGEVTSGLFGANRVGDGLTEMLCQGQRAGKTAIKYISEIEESKIDDYYISKIIDKINVPFKNTESEISSQRIHRRIEEISDEGFWCIRTEGKMEKALTAIEQLEKDEMNKIFIKNRTKNYNYELIDYLQCENLLTCVKAGLISAINRKESRGCHIRLDYPKVDHDNYLYRSVISEHDRNMKLDKIAPYVTKMELPKGTKENIIEYFLNKNLDYKR
jgi:succinate dehydrogenase/fumarate reductase flavoprotein subunit